MKGECGARRGEHEAKFGKYEWAGRDREQVSSVKIAHYCRCWPGTYRWGELRQDHVQGEGQ